MNWLRHPALSACGWLALCGTAQAQTGEPAPPNRFPIYEDYIPATQREPARLVPVESGWVTTGGSRSDDSAAAAGSAPSPPGRSEPAGQLAQPASWEQTGESTIPRPNTLREPPVPRAVPTADPLGTPGEYISESPLAPLNPQQPPAQPAAQSPAQPPAQIPQQPSGGRPASPPAAGSESDPVPAALDNQDEVPGSEQIQARIAEVEGAEGIDETEKSRQLQHLNRALEWRQVSEQAQRRIEQLRADIEQAPQAIQETRARLAEPREELQIVVPHDATVVSLVQQLGEVESRLSSAQETLARAVQQADAKTRADRKTEIAKLGETAAAQLAEVQRDLSAGAVEGESPAVATARRARLLNKRAALQRQQAQFEAERRRDEAWTELYPLERDLAQRNVRWLETAAAKWREIVATLRRRESERQAAEARRKLSNAHPSLHGIAEQNALLTEKRKELNTLMGRTAGHLETTNADLELLRGDFERVTSKVEVGGMTAAAGLLLRNRADHMPKPAPYREHIRFCSAEMQRVQLEMLELEEDRARLGDVDAIGERILEEVRAEVDNVPPEQIESMIRELLQYRRQYLDDLLNDYKAYHEDLSDLELAARSMLRQRDLYARYIDERVLWIRSEQPLEAQDARRAWSGLMSFADPRDWAGVGGGGFRAIVHQPLVSGAVALSFIGLLFFRRRWRNRLTRLGDQAENASSLWPTLQVVVLTLLIASVWPMLLWYVGWLLYRAVEGGLAHDLAHALQVTAVLFWTVETTRQICRPGGLGEDHFGWHHATLQRLHGGLLWLILFGLPTVFLVTACEAHHDGEWKDSLGRIVFLAGTGLLTYVLHRFLKPTGGVVQHWLQRRGTPAWQKLPYLVYLLGMGVPLSLMGLSVFGYTYSAYQLLSRLNHSLWLLVGLVLIHAMLARGCEILRRRMVLRKQIAPAGGTDALANAEPRQTAEEVAQETTAQLRQLLRGVFVFSLLIGSGLIWADMFPALGILNRVELWSTNRTVYETVFDADGIARQHALTQPVPVTLASLLFCGLVVAGTMVATRAMPGLLQVTLLRRLPIDNGGRHAIALISRYLVTLLGLLVAGSMLGITWSSLQWLAAAMTVGLGFGLQEIFANFVSGVIILLERPIRVGDLVTVDGTSGTVTRMQIRATTITDFERRELIVPNKKFITENVVNWTLSDPITRFVIPVGISYASDSTKARELLMNVARSHPLILKEPPPFALMTGFGDSTKNFELRAFLGSRQFFGDVLHEVLVSIERAFSEAGIEIAFPQQEITIKRINGVQVEEQQVSPRRSAA